MTQALPRAGDPLRVSDLVPLRRMLGTDSIVIRINPDGSFVPFERMPALFFDRSIRHVLSDAVKQQFEARCAQVIEQRTAMVFRLDGFDGTDEVMINPILDNDGIECRFLVCWARATDVIKSDASNLVWEDLTLDAVVVRYRTVLDQGTAVVEAAPWWALPEGELLELWPHHTHVSAMGLGHAVMELLIRDAAEAATEDGGGPAVRLEIPSADMLAGLVPVFHGAVRASGLDPHRVVVAIAVDLAVDPDLLPIIVHLRTMGLQIDIVGLDALTATLHTVSDTSDHAHPLTPRIGLDAGEWTDSFPVHS